MLRGGKLNTLIAMLLAALNLWMLEYFFVLELARPLVIWLSGRAGSHDAPQCLRTTARRWLPFVLVFILAVLSRLFVFNNQIYGFGLKRDFVDAPVAATIALSESVLQSLWTATFVAWGQAFRLPDLEADGPRTLAVYTVVVLAAAAAAAMVFSRNRSDNPGRSTGAKAMLGLGLLMLILAGPPFWLTGVPVSLDFPASRAMLSFAPGASLLLTGVVLLVPSAAWRLGLVTALVGLATGRQFLWSNEFRRDWESHKEFFWQLTWRAPGLAPNTVIMTNQDLEFYADNSLGAALNWIYASGNHARHVDYVLFFPTNRVGGSLPALEPDLPVSYSYLAGDFEGTTSQTLALLYDPPRCLRVLDPEIDPHNHMISDDSLMRQAASLSSTEWVLTTPAARMPAAYGAEPRHGWCYYFQQADLARQVRDWARVAELGDVALALGDHPNDPIERFVFVEGYAHTGQWQRAQELTLASYGVSESIVGPLLCRLWDRIERDAPAIPERDATLSQVRTKLACSA
jgi:hypothetical protein